jgi:hypothetical protein
VNEHTAPGAGGRGWPREGLRGRHTGPGADGEALGAARGWLPGAVDGPRSQALTRRCLGGRATLRGGVGGWGSGCGHRTEPQPRLCTLCPSPSQRHALASDCLQLKWSKHVTPCAPGSLSAVQQQQAVRGQGTVCAALTCAVRASTRVMATQLTLDDRGGVLQAAHTVCQRTGHGAPKAAPPRDFDISKV